MKVLLINTTDIDGGAARAAYRLNKGLQTVGVDSQMLVQTKKSDDRSVMGGSAISGIAKIKAGSRLSVGQLPLKLYPHRDRNNYYSLQWLPDNLPTQVKELDPDIINLHWIGDSYMQIETVPKLAKLNKPIVWTVHDMWVLTGGCHYSGECDRYKIGCGNCPLLGSKRLRDLSQWVWNRKNKAWKNLNLTLVAPSYWLAKCLQSNPIFEDKSIEVIPNGLDTKIYQPIEREVARKILKLPQDKKLVLFGALSATSDVRKGFQLLMPALQKLSQQAKWQDKIELVVFGSSSPQNPPDLGFKAHYLGRFNDDLSLSVVYSAADVMVVPSLQESFGQTASESLACGTPVAAFNATGLKDIVTHQEDGYLAQPYEIEDLARGITWVLADEAKAQKLSANARQKAETKFSFPMQTQKYLELLDSLHH